jgi:hypothetical protein
MEARMPILNSKRVIVAAGVTPSTAPASATSIEAIGGPLLFPMPTSAPQSPPPLLTSSSTSDQQQQTSSSGARIAADVVMLTKCVADTTKALSQNFANLSAVSQAYVQEVAASTAVSCETLLQASNFLDFQVNSSIECSRQILQNMEKIQSSSVSARKLLADMKAVSETVTMVEGVLTQLERERGLPPPKKKGLFS